MSNHGTRFVKQSVCRDDDDDWSKKLFYIRLKSDVNKLSVCIYLNRVPFGARHKSYDFKSLVKLGSQRPNFKITHEERPFVILFNFYFLL